MGGSPTSYPTALAHTRDDPVGVAGDPLGEEALPLGVGERDAVQRLELNPQVVDQEFFALTGRYSSACSCNRAMTARSRSASDW